MNDTEFFVRVGRAACVACLIFTFAAAVATLARAIQATEHLNDPVFTAPPDSSRATHSPR